MYSRQTLFTDITWNSVDSTIWTIMEPGVYFIASCLLTYRPLVLQLINRDFKKLPSSNNFVRTPV